jgi:hypothetical protein
MTDTDLCALLLLMGLAGAAGRLLTVTLARPAPPEDLPSWFIETP